MTAPPPAPAQQYARLRYCVMLVDLIGSLLLLVAYQATGLSVEAARWAESRFAWPAAQVAAYLMLFGLCSWLVFLPLRVYSGFALEHRFGLSRQTLRSWIRRELKRAAIASALGLLVVEGLYTLLRVAPDTWIVWATAGWIVLSVVLARIFPTWLLPIFYKVTTLEDPALVQRLIALCERARLPVLGVFRVHFGAETRKANAALAGLGRTRRVLVSDTMLESFTPEEIETVLAHELGHQRFRHITWFLILSTVGSLIAFSLVDLASSWWVGPLGLYGLDDLVGFPMLMLSLSVIGLIGLPLQNAISRRFEWQSDRFALSLTARPQPFACALTKLAELNLADPAPPAWIVGLFYDHPPIRERIRAAEMAAKG